MRGSLTLLKIVNFDVTVFSTAQNQKKNEKVVFWKIKESLVSLFTIVTWGIIHN